VIERVTAGNKLLYERDDRPLGRVVDATYVAEMNAMMQQTLLIGTAKHASLPGWPAAGKTGTSQDFRDAWFMGYTAHLVTGVWLGNDDGTPTKHVTGGSLPVEIWSRFMRSAHQGVPVAALPGTGGSSGHNFLFGLFGGTRASLPAASTVGAAPMPPADIGAKAAPARGESGGLDGWLLNNLFGRR
jgi:penicillin-binding protein 1A